jgi:hypothetical protein
MPASRRIIGALREGWPTTWEHGNFVFWGQAECGWRVGADVVKCPEDALAALDRQRHDICPNAEGLIEHASRRLVYTERRAWPARLEALSSPERHARGVIEGSELEGNQRPQALLSRNRRILEPLD